MAKPPRRGAFSRSRGLAELRAHFPVDLAAFLSKRLAESPEVAVLEIGCGEGKLLMELRRQFPTIELHGINKAPWPAMRGPASLRRTGVFYKIFTRREIDTVALPEVHFYDATTLGFADASLDLIVSQRSIHYIERKELVIQEAWRTLRPGGLALLQVDELKNHMPDFFVGETPRFIVYDGAAHLPLARHLAALRARGFQIELYQHDAYGARTSSVCMVKNVDAPLDLGLDYDENSSFTLEVPGRPRDIFWGHRSVYRVRRQPAP